MIVGLCRWFVCYLEGLFDCAVNVAFVGGVAILGFRLFVCLDNIVCLFDAWLDCFVLRLACLFIDVGWIGCVYWFGFVV